MRSFWDFSAGTQDCWKCSIRFFKNAHLQTGKSQFLLLSSGFTGALRKPLASLWAYARSSTPAQSKGEEMAALYSVPFCLTSRGRSQWTSEVLAATYWIQELVGMWTDYLQCEQCGVLLTSLSHPCLLWCVRLSASFLDTLCYPMDSWKNMSFGKHSLLQNGPSSRRECPIRVEVLILRGFWGEQGSLQGRWADTGRSIGLAQHRICPQ